MFFYLLAAVIVVIDQFTKWLIVKNLEIGESIEVIENFLYITSHRNSGAAWGILQGQLWFFYIITIIAIIGMIYYIQRFAQGRRLPGTAVALMLGGAIGNFIDRVFRKEVVDFVNTFIFGYDFPVFNIADSALVTGVFLLFIHLISEEKAAKEKNHGKNGTHHS